MINTEVYFHSFGFKKGVPWSDRNGYGIAFQRIKIVIKQSHLPEKQLSEGV